jgi:hypothetical protein
MPEPLASAGSKLLAEEFASMQNRPQEDPSLDYGPDFHNLSATRSKMETYQKEPEHDGDDDDAMEILTQDLHLTEKFLGRLHTHDVDPASGSFAAQQTVLEKLASDVI